MTEFTNPVPDPNSNRSTNSQVPPASPNRLTDLGFKFCFALFPAVMLYIILTDGDGCGDLPRDFKFFPIAGGSALLIAIVWALIDRQKKHYDRLKYGLQILTRYFLAYIILQYGIAKVIDMQFNPSLSGLDTRPADMRPMTVAWTFFGYSFQYEFFIGVSQILAGILLVYKRTTTLGAILMVTIMGNIVFVNFAFDVCVKFFSCTYLAMSLYLLLDDAVRLINFLILNKTAEKRIYPELFKKPWAKKVFYGSCALVLVAALGTPTYKTLKSKIEYGIGTHTALYGVWTVDSVHAASDSVNRILNADSSGWKKLLLEDFGSGSIKSWKNGRLYFNYSLDTVKKTLGLRAYYPDTTTSIHTSYIRKKDTLFLQGSYNKDSISLKLHLERKYFIRK